MGAIKDKSDQTYRDFATAGVASSGPHNPSKADQRALGALIETEMAKAALAGMLSAVFDTLADANAGGGSLDYEDGAIALISADADPANNGLAIKSGASGAGTWVPSPALQNIVQILTDPVVAEATADVEEAIDAVKKAMVPSIWPDHFFTLTAGNDDYTNRGRRAYVAAQPEREWDGSFKHRYGKGAWKHGANANLMGFATWFDTEPALEVGVAAGDIISIGALVQGASSGKGIGLSSRFFAGADTAWTTSQVTDVITSDGELQLLTIDNLTVPAGADGVTGYLYGTGTTDEFHVIAYWVVRAPSAGEAPPARVSRPLLSEIIGAALGYTASAQAQWAVDEFDLVEWSAKANEHVAANKSSLSNRILPFSGWAETFVTPGSISFNALQMTSLTRSSAATAKWDKIGVVVRTHPTNAAGAGSTLVAVGEVQVRPDESPLSNVVVPLRDPVTGDFKTVTEADLDADFLVGYYAETADGSDAAISELKGTISTLTRRQSFYITTQNAKFEAWSNFSTNPGLGIEMVTLTDPSVKKAYEATASLRASLGLNESLTQLSDPDPRALILAPRCFGVVGREMNAYFQDMHSSMETLDYNVDSTSSNSLGQQLKECWRFTPLAAVNNGTLTFETRDPAHLGVLDQKTQRIDVTVANAPAGASRRVMALGDSTTNAGVWTQRMLDVAGDNPDGVQLTMVGTRGTAPNLHEGRGGWSMQRYFQPSGADVAENPFVETDGGKFNMAYYLSDTGQAAPDIVIVHLGINDVFGQSNDAGVNSIMDTFIDQLNRIIGVTADGTVGSLKESNASVKTLIALPISPTGSQDAFGDDYVLGQSLSRYERNIKVASHRLIEAYSAFEGDNIFLVPWNTCIDPEHGWPWTQEPANAAIPFETVASYATQAADLSPSDGEMFFATDAAKYIVKVGASGAGAYREAGTDDGIVRRQNNGVHPTTPGVGYYQMGDTMSDAVNCLVGLGLA